MHIAIDGKRYFRNTSGLGRYSRTLVKALVQLPQEQEFSITLFKPKGKTLFAEHLHPRLSVVQARYMLPGDLGNGIWRFRTLPKLITKEKFTIFHGPSHVIPLKCSCPTVVTMFDLIFLRYPQYFRRWDRIYYGMAFKKSAQRADHIISISEATKADLITYCGVDPAKITVIYPGIDEVFSLLAEDELKSVNKKFGLPPAYILYVGTIEPRKNILTLARAFDLACDRKHINPDYHLVIAGQKGWFYDDVFAGIDKLSNKHRIMFLGPVYGKELAALYQAATVMAYPSQSEGFGYPVIEAMKLGTPVLTSGTSSMVEAGGDAAHLVDPMDIEAIEAGLVRIINDPLYRSELIRKGSEHVQQFSPRIMAQQTFEVYRHLANS